MLYSIYAHICAMNNLHYEHYSIEHLKVLIMTLRACFIFHL